MRGRSTVRMRFESGPMEWTVRESTGDPFVIALYVRDRAGLHADSIEVPPLKPAVTPAPSTHQRMEQESAGWAKWWTSLVDRAISGEGAALGGDSEEEFSKRAEFSHIPFSEPSRWLSDRTLEQIRRPSDQTRASRILVDAAVRKFEEAAGRTANAFALDLVILPVQGNWWYQATPTLVFLSQDLRSDRTRFLELLSPVLGAIA